ncbi:MAG: hypothetical protein R6V19_09315 [Armatimonadota bacterium]
MMDRKKSDIERDLIKTLQKESEEDNISRFEKALDTVRKFPPKGMSLGGRRTEWERTSDKAASVSSDTT